MSEGSVLNLLQNIAHAILDGLVNHPWPRHVIAKLSGIADRVAHALHATLEHQVDDQLHLVQALVIRNFWLVTRLDEHFPASLDQRGDATAQYRLLAEEIGLGLFFEGRFDQPGLGAAHGVAIRKSELPSLACRVLLDRDQ